MTWMWGVVAVVVAGPSRMLPYASRTWLYIRRGQRIINTLGPERRAAKQDEQRALYSKLRKQFNK